MNKREKVGSFVMDFYKNPPVLGAYYVPLFHQNIEGNKPDLIPEMIDKSMCLSVDISI